MDFNTYGCDKNSQKYKAVAQQKCFVDHIFCFILWENIK